MRCSPITPAYVRGIPVALLRPGGVPMKTKTNMKAGAKYIVIKETDVVISG